ncbi:hypothetical protein ACFOTA_24035 [Chitinophaga sp. GCM10012297]|uniref:GLPGLI family protein n=1 Tax=Chitinophaga chungangae TaxID=2821488 RepID=A0ABS3YKW8_9BACT|nr:hypothetical protein [Chitinophaga chungangae]MBO9155302.1 hypothetical protein [Chitinophaga chungangae]
MKKPILLALAMILSMPALHAQLLKKLTGKKKQPAETEETIDETFPQARGSAKNAQPEPTLIIGGDDAVKIDSSYEYDWAVYQESEAFQGSQRVIDGGEDIVIYYSSTQAAFSIQLKSRSTGTKYHFYGDFGKESQLMLAGVGGIASGDKTRLQLEGMEPVYPGEIGYLSQLTRTGSKKVIAGVACEEYVAHNLRQDPRVVNTNHSKVTAYVWIPMDPHAVFPGYSLMPEHFKIQIERMRIAGSYPPVVMPLEMFLEYGNGDKVFTHTTHIIVNERRKVELGDINK